MKKNAMLKIAAILMVAVLLTTCAISSTFAKYTTSDKDQADARVAKWGVAVVTSLDGLFAKSRTVGDKLVVESDTEIVAPGMSGEVEVARKITGTPEVAVKVTTKATVTLTGWGEHCPLVFKINGTEYAQIVDDPTTNDKVEGEDVETFAGRIANAIKAASTYEFAPGTNLAADRDTSAEGVQNFDMSIEWRWAFDGDDDEDTTLGNNAAGVDYDGKANGTTAATVVFELETIVEQIESFS